MTIPTQSAIQASSAHDRDPRRRKAALISTALATLAACLVLLPLLGHKTLADWDEGIYAEVSREMLAGSWLVPHWNYQIWLEKPPLTLWITAIFFKLFGITEFWARAGSALSGVAIIVVQHVWLERRRDLLTAWLSTLILLATFGFLHVCRVGETDVLLSLGCCVALIGLCEVETGTPVGWYLFWGGFAIALMAKGAASMVLLFTAVLVVALSVWKPARWKTASFGRTFWLGIALFLLLVLPWHLVMLARFGHSFVAEYLGLHVLARATGQIEGHTSRWWFYFKVLFVSAPPFVLLYPFAVGDALRRVELRIWAVFSLVVVAFFTAVQTRLPHYIAPAYPALALLTAVFLADHLRPFAVERRPASFWLKLAAFAIAASAASLFFTGPLRRELHSATLADGSVMPDNHDSIDLLRAAFRQPQPIGGPLLLWRGGRISSIATDVFYSQRQVQQVRFRPRNPDTVTNKYSHAPIPLDEAITSEPRLILLDKSFVRRIPTIYLYTPIQSGKAVELGSIVRAP